MNQRWTISFKGLGLIEEGSVRIAPLMLFTGDNNSGKSYVMVLLWGIIALGRTLFPDKIPQSRSYQSCQRWLSEKISFMEEHNIEGIKIEPQDMNLFVEWFSENLNNKRHYLSNQLFGEDRVKIKELSIGDYSRESSLELRIEKNGQHNNRYSSGKNHVRFPMWEETPGPSEIYRMIQYLAWKIVIGDLGAPLYPPQNMLAIPAGEILYLPAARTGFTLMRKMLASAAFGSGGENMNLLLPARRFMQRFLNISFEGKKNDYSSFADILESEVLLGHIGENNAPLPDYSYYPAGKDGDSIPLWLTSSLVTEISPLLLFLRSGDRFNSLIIEEPEAHLHLEMQKALARLLVRLVNKGLPIWFTTHGDTFFQQMSNLVKASSVDGQTLKEISLDRNETIEPKDVSAFYFRRQVDQREKTTTNIDSLTVDEGGIAGPAFNDSILSLAEETFFLKKAIEKRETDDED
ncbi:MAG: hypothetical protein EOM12_14245 [Verrucomicrobiae bacterium]|nr:hypothetical protein [Verrucomicrobiae bacterium]